ncbi:MAG: hypothetical protein ACM3ZE_29860 [Myxococcales bacterium]
MSKLVIFSIVIASVAIPMFFAKGREPKLALRKTIWAFVYFNVLYVLALVYLVPRLL